MVIFFLKKAEQVLHSIQNEGRNLVKVWNILLQADLSEILSSQLLRWLRQKKTRKNIEIRPVAPK